MKKMRRPPSRSLLYTIPAALIIALAVRFAPSLPVSASGPGNSGAPDRESRVVSVTDGDTIRVRTEGRVENVRLIGIDTPESSANKKARRDSKKSHTDVSEITRMGHEAADFTKSLVRASDPVRIECDVTPRDRYGRLLGYVFLHDGRMLNEQIIRAGYASPLTIPPNVKYSKLFAEAYRYARDKKLGLWKE